MKPKQVAVLGCGPSGLLAAHAAILKGHEPHIFSVKQKSPMPGAQYLHQPIPRLGSSRPDGTITYYKHGTKQGYAQRVYGSPDAECSWTKFQDGEHDIWSIGKMYDELWDVFEDDIYDKIVIAGDVGELMEEYAAIISTIPAPKLCEDGEHTFHNQTVFIKDEAVWDPNQDHGVDVENFIVYNGTLPFDRVNHWYRTSRIFGKEGTETTAMQSSNGWRYGHKPLHTDCDCHSQWEPMFIRAGRFGKWKRGVLVHQAFWDIIRELDNAIGKGPGAVL